jgi:hypothetical protein
MLGTTNSNTFAIYKATSLILLANNPYVNALEN